MDLKHLRQFVTICETKSVTKASKKLNIAQPSLSLSLSQLEKEYNCKLFDRVSRKMILTEEGKRLYDLATTIISQCDAIPDLINPINNTMSIRIASSITFATFSLIDKAKYIQDNFNNVNLEIIVTSSYMVEKLVKNSEVDIGIIEGMAHFDIFNLKPINKDHLVFVSAITSDVVIERFEDLKNKKFLLREQGSAHREIFESLFESSKIPYSVRMESIDTNVLIKACENDLGICFLPYGFVAEKLGKSLRLLEIEDINKVERVYSLIYYKNKHINNVMRDIIKIFES